MSRHNNSGVQITAYPPGPEKTFLVIGSPRGGTSMLCGCLHHLGIFTGDESKPSVFEDRRLSKAFERKADLSGVISDYNRRYPVWAFKKPSLNRRIFKYLKLFRRPAIIFITRDPVAVASRRMHQQQSGDFNSHLRHVLKVYSELSSRVARSRMPVFYCSYEKALQDPEAFVQSLCEFTGFTDLSEEQMAAAAEFIRPEPQDYVNWCRAEVAAIGHLDGLHKGHLVGWSAYRHRDEQVELELRVNGEVQTRFMADKQRDDLKAAGIKADGRAGYSFFLEEHLRQPGNEIRICVAEDGEDLIGSPYIIPADEAAEPSSPAQSQ